METIPQGAIWVKNYRLRKNISNFISTRNIECPKCRAHFQDELTETQEADLNETVVNHVMTVKIKAMREKYIAIYNPKASLSTHPSYFLYVYQAYTGAPSVYPFTDSPAGQTDRVSVSIGQRQTSAGKDTRLTTGTYQSGIDSHRGEDKDIH